MKPLLSIAIIVKNETEQTIKTLSSVIDYVDHVVIMTTVESTDQTINLIKNFCRQKEKPLKLQEKSPYDRNYLLKMCYGLSEFVLLLDVNEEAKNMDILIASLKKIKTNVKETMFRCRYILVNENGQKGNNQTFYKVGVVRNNIIDIHYEFPVYEYITSSSKKINELLTSNHFYIYQDNLLVQPIMQQLSDNIKILHEYIEKNGENSRAYGYLIKCYKTLLDYPNMSKYCDKQIEYYEKNYPTKFKFYDEYYQALMNKGYAYGQMDIDEFFKWYLKAYKHSQLLYANAEPLIYMGQFYIQKNIHQLAYMYLKKACLAPSPPDTLIDTSINYNLYNVRRWELMAKIAPNLNHFDDYYESLSKLGPQTSK